MISGSRFSQALNEKALEVRDALLEALVSKAREQNNHIISRYDSILARIAEKPTNEADLAALRCFITDSKEQVGQLLGTPFLRLALSSC